MDFLGWTIADPTNTKNLKDSKVYAINKKGESFTAETIDAAMRVIMGRDIEIKIEMDAEEQGFFSSELPKVKGSGIDNIP